MPKPTRRHLCTLTALVALAALTGCGPLPTPAELTPSAVMGSAQEKLRDQGCAAVLPYLSAGSSGVLQRIDEVTGSSEFSASAQRTIDEVGALLQDTKAVPGDAKALLAQAVDTLQTGAETVHHAALADCEARAAATAEAQAQASKDAGLFSVSGAWSRVQQAITPAP